MSNTTLKEGPCKLTFIQKFVISLFKIKSVGSCKATFICTIWYLYERSRDQLALTYLEILRNLRKLSYTVDEDKATYSC